MDKLRYTQSRAYSRFLEKMERGNVSSSPSSHVWPVVVIEAGISANGNLYSPEVLREAAPMLEGRPVATYSFTFPATQANGHLPIEVRRAIPEGLAANTVGALRNVRMEQVPSVRRPGKNWAIVADFHITCPWLRESVENAHEAHVPELFELSVEVEGPHRNVSRGGRIVHEIKRIVRFTELTIVVDAAAGGRVLKKAESGAEPALALATFVESVLDPKDRNDAADADKESSAEAKTETETATEGEKTMNVRKRLVRAVRALGHTESVEDLTQQQIASRIAEAALSQPSRFKEELDLERVVAMLREGMLEEAISELEAAMTKKDDPENPSMESPTPDPDPPTPTPTPTPDLSSLTEAEERIAAREARMAESEKAMRLIRCESILDRQLAGSNLPPDTQDRIREWAKGRIFKESELSDKITSERDYLSRVTESLEPAVRARMSHISVGRNRLDWMRARADQLFGFRPQYDRMVESEADTYRQVYRDGRPSLFRFFRDWYDSDRFWLERGGSNAIFREATSSDLTDLLQDSARKRLVQAYNAIPALWREVAEVVEARDFKAHDLVLLGGMGVLATVTEGSQFPELGIHADEKITYTPAKRGGLIKITLEMILSDDLDGLQRLPDVAADQAMLTLNGLAIRGAIGALGATDASGIGNDLTYDGTALFSTDHKNLTNNAIDYQEVVDMLERLLDQERFGNVFELAAAFGTGVTTITLRKVGGDAISDLSQLIKADDVLRIESEEVFVTAVSTSNTATVTRGFGGTTDVDHNTVGTRVVQLAGPISPRSIRVVGPEQLRSQIWQILNSRGEAGTANNEENMLMADDRVSSLIVHKRYLMGDLNNYYMLADKPVRVGFVGGVEEPELRLSDDPVLSSDRFNKDQIAWKVWHAYGVATPEFEKVQGGLVTG